jgi:hypothetical protein
MDQIHPRCYLARSCACQRDALSPKSSASTWKIVSQNFLVILLRQRIKKSMNALLRERLLRPIISSLGEVASRF